VYPTVLPPYGVCHRAAQANARATFSANQLFEKHNAPAHQCRMSLRQGALASSLQDCSSGGPGLCRCLQTSSLPTAAGLRNWRMSGLEEGSTPAVNSLTESACIAYISGLIQNTQMVQGWICTQRQERSSVAASHKESLCRTTHITLVYQRDIPHPL
jgi:hypothetical protein